MSVPTGALLGFHDRAIQQIEAAIAAGFTPVHALENAPVFAPYQSRPEYRAIIERAKQRQRIALAIFERGGGPELLGITPAQAL